MSPSEGLGHGMRLEQFKTNLPILLSVLLSMDRFVPITTAVNTLGVLASTLRRREASGRLVPTRTQGRQRRYLASDVLEIITVFSARLYGSRSHRNQKLIDGLRQAVQEAQC